MYNSQISLDLCQSSPHHSCMSNPFTLKVNLMVDDATILPWLFKVITNINMASDFHRHLYTLTWLSSFMAMGHTCICIVVGNITMILVLKSGKWKDHSLKVSETTDVNSCSHYMCFVAVGWMVSQSMQKDICVSLKFLPTHRGHRVSESCWINMA